MKYIIKAPAQIKEAINLPASKSISNRALVIHAMTGGDIRPINLSDCDDTEVIINALQKMPEVIDIKAAGTAMRFMTAFLAATNGEHTITGTERMKNRPIGILVDALRYIGADIEYAGKAGYPPLHIKGHPLEGGHLEVVGNISSQYISALLMIGPFIFKMQEEISYSTTAYYLSIECPAKTPDLRKDHEKSCYHHALFLCRLPQSPLLFP